MAGVYGGFGKLRFSERQINSLISRWESAEQNIKRVEVLSGSLAIPAIIELRYAGRRVVDALSAATGSQSKPDETELLLREAEQHVLRAEYKAIDAMIAYVKKNSEKLRNQDEHLKQIDDIQRLLISSRTNALTRGSQYNDIRYKFDRLLDTIPRSFFVDPDSTRNSENLKDLARSRQLYLLVTVAAVTSFVALFISLLGFLNF